MKLKKDVHKALRKWHKANTKSSPIDYLSLFQQLKHQGQNTRRATNQVILNALQLLEVERPEDASLLRKHFIDEQIVTQIANQLNISQELVYKRQRQAIEHLTEVLYDMEQEATARQQRRLERALNPPTYQELIGVNEHLRHLRDTLVSPEPPWIVSISGIGGIGKTSLADALVRQIIRQGFYNDFGWVSGRQNFFNLGGSIKEIKKPALTMAALVEALVGQLLGLGVRQLSVEGAFAALENRLKESPHLIVIDNLETLLDLETLLPTLRRLTNPSKFLLTSRKSLYTEAHLYHFSLPQLSETNVLQLIRAEARQRHLPHLVEASDEVLKPIYATVGGNPLAVRLIVGQSHIHHLSAVLYDLTQARGKKAENLYRYIYRRAWDNLDEVTRHAFLFMPLMAPQGDSFEHLQIMSQLESHELRCALELLVTLNLVDVTRRLNEWQYSIHNLTRSFLQEQVVKWQ
jgi:hypothetical protein